MYSINHENDFDAFIKKTKSFGNSDIVRSEKPGILQDYSFAVKDNFKVKDHKNCFGNPTWYQTHEASKTTSRSVEDVLKQGAYFYGFTHTDELTFSLNGENYHYGTPQNPLVPNRIPGGSSSGSAVAVASGLVDFALGSDTAGSIRVPSSYCGVFGIRTTHGRISYADVLPLAPSFGTVGWFAKDMDILQKVGHVIFGSESPTQLHDSSRTEKVHQNLLLCKEALDLTDPQIADDVVVLTQRILGTDSLCGNRQKKDPELVEITKGMGSLDSLAKWLDVFRTQQAYEVWQCHGAWVQKFDPELGPGVKERILFGKQVSKEQYEKAIEQKSQIQKHLDTIINKNNILVLPTAPQGPPELNTSQEILNPIRSRIMQLTSIAGLGGYPQVSIPLGFCSTGPYGVSFIGPRNWDEELIDMCRKIAKALNLQQLKKQ